MRCEQTNICENITFPELRWRWVKTNKSTTELFQVEEHDVPILSTGYKESTNDWDMATTQLLPYIDGFRHVAKIAADSDVDVNIVKVCVQNLGLLRRRQNHINIPGTKGLFTRTVSVFVNSMC